MRYFIKADHPTLSRPDRLVSAIELEPLKEELKLAGYENIRVEKLFSKKEFIECLKQIDTRTETHNII